MPTLLGEIETTREGTTSLVKKKVGDLEFMTTEDKFSRTYYVLSDTTINTVDEIKNTGGVPRINTTLLGARCKSVKTRDIQTVPNHPVTGVAAILYEVTCDFDSATESPEEETDPTDWKPKVRWFGESEEEVLEKDAIDVGVAIETVPGEPIIILAPIVLPVLEVKRFELPPFNPTTILNFANHTNASTFYGAPVGSALMLPMDVGAEEEVGEEKLIVIPVTYRVKFNIKEEGGALKEDTWKARPLHHGFKFFPEVGKPAETFTDKHGNPATVNLAANGTKLAKGAGPVFLSFNKFPKVNFNLLNLGPF